MCVEPSGEKRGAESDLRRRLRCNITSAVSEKIKFSDDTQMMLSFIILFMKGSFYYGKNQPSGRHLKNIEIIFIIAFFIALRIVFSKLLAINVTNNFPLSLENTPILLAAVAYGHLVGAVVGGISALISCLLVGIFDQPVITESSSSTRSSVVSAALKKHSRTYFPKYLS